MIHYQVKNSQCCTRRADNLINPIFGQVSYRADILSFEILNIRLDQFIALDRIKLDPFLHDQYVRSVRLVVFKFGLSTSSLI